MKQVKFLQQTNSIADYFIQTLGEIATSLPQSDPYSRRIPSRIQKKKLLAGQWDGHERRGRVERRASERRNERLMAMLDTRARTDRRQLSRRLTDELALRSFSCRV